MFSTVYCSILLLDIVNLLYSEIYKFNFITGKYV